jgi:hypothetical protein
MLEWLQAQLFALDKQLEMESRAEIPPDSAQPEVMKLLLQILAGRTAPPIGTPRRHSLRPMNCGPCLKHSTITLIASGTS